MKTPLTFALLFSLAASAQQLKTDDEKSLYAIGYVLGSRNLAPLNLKPNELEIVKRGLIDGATGKKAAKEPGAKKIDINLDGGRKSSLVIKTLTPGNGPNPQPTDKVKVNYEGRLTNGTVFDSSYKRGQPAEFGLNQVIKCWTEGVQRMKVGEKARLTCPSDVAYGDQGRPPQIPGGATL